MARKLFMSKVFKDFFYEVIDEKWLDDDTYVMVCQDMIDVDGDKYHLEVEYHKDENKITYIRVYEYDTMNAENFVSTDIKKGMEEYILRQCKVLSNDSAYITKSFPIELKLEVGLDVTISELSDWLNNLSVDVKSASSDNRIRLISSMMKEKY